MIKDVLKRQTTIIAVTVITLCIGLIGISYAFFFDIKSSNSQSVTSGTLTVQFAETKNSFLTNFSNATGPVEAEPMDDTEGSTGDGYQFSVTNTGTLPMKYNIYLYDDPTVTTGTKLEKKFIKIKLDDGNIQTLDQLTCEEKNAKDLGESGEKISICKINGYELGVKAKGAENNEAIKEHIVRIWISDTAGENEVDKIIALKLVVLGEVGEAKEPPKPKSFSEIVKVDNTNIFADEAGNIRYAGPSDEVNNYIWFNCDTYEGLTNENASGHCEKWRIIGLMNEMTKVDEDTKEEKSSQSLVKIIREESIGNIAWDNKPAGNDSSEREYGSNNWSSSRLMMLLNPGYEKDPLNDNGLTGSLYWNRQDGACGAAKNNDLTEVPNGTSIECGFGSKGLYDNETKNMIENVKWNLGSLSDSSVSDTNYQLQTASTWYKYERGAETCLTTKRCTKEHATEWTGKIGLIYPSDYGYATAGGNSKSRQVCLDYQLYNWKDADYTEDCVGNNWLYISNTLQWALTSRSSDSYSVYGVYPNGRIDSDLTYTANIVRPVLYLKSNVKLLDDGVSDGSIDKPYILVPGNVNLVDPDNGGTDPTDPSGETSPGGGSTKPNY